MIILLRIVLQLLTAPVGLIALSVRYRRANDAENLMLRRQFALFKERGVKPRRVDAARRMSPALPSRFRDWRHAVVVVETVIRSHRAGRRLFWRWKPRTARPLMALGTGISDPRAGALRRANERSRHDLGATAVLDARIGLTDQFRITKVPSEFSSAGHGVKDAILAAGRLEGVQEPIVFNGCWEVKRNTFLMAMRDGRFVVAE